MNCDLGRTVAVAAQTMQLLRHLRSCADLVGSCLVRLSVLALRRVQNVVV